MKSFTFCILLAHVLAFPLFAQKNAAITLNLAKAITQSPKTVMLSELASDVRYFPLETTDNCLLGNECSIVYAGNSIIAGDAQTRSFYRFDKNGKFMNKIGQHGQGPEDYAVGLLFFTDPDNQKLYVQDFQDLICYDFNGKFIRRIPAPHLNMGTGAVSSGESILYCDNNYFIRKDNPQQLFLIDGNGKKLKSWKGYIEPGKKYGINLSTRDVMYLHGGSVYFKPALENLVYKIDADRKKTLAWKLDCSGKDVDVSANEIDPAKRFKSIAVQQVFETDHYFFILYVFKNEGFVGLYDKQKKSFSNVIIKDDLAAGFDFTPPGSGLGNQLANARMIGYLSKNKRYSKALLPARKKELDELMNRVDEEDNPVMVVVTFK